MLTAVLYARYSPRPDKKDAEGHTIECESCVRQLYMMREYCEKMKWPVIHEESDEDVSGGGLSRPNLWNAIQMLKRGGVLLVYRLNRLTRGGIYDLVTIEKALKPKQCRIVSVMGEGTWAESPTDDLVRNILACVAEHERIMIGARTSAAVTRYIHHDHRALGMRPRNFPYGWQRNPHDRDYMIPDQTETAIAHFILHLHQAGYGIKATSNWLFRSHVPSNRFTFKGAPASWDHQTVRKIRIAMSKARIAELDRGGQAIYNLLVDQFDKTRHLARAANQPRGGTPITVPCFTPAAWEYAEACPITKHAER